jgi:hypothetical protein
MFGILKALKKGIGFGVGSGTGSGSTSYGSADLDPHQKVTARIPNTDIVKLKMLAIVSKIKSRTNVIILSSF